VELAGGADALLAAARRSFAVGDYRWVAEVVGHLVFADPTNTAARELQADALEQLGYQSESATFRNAYLMGAQELRHGPPPSLPAGHRKLVKVLPVEQLMATVAVRLKAEDVGGLRAVVNLALTDTGESWVLELSHRSLHYRLAAPHSDADATVTTSREVLAEVFMGDTTLAAAVAAGTLQVSGDVEAVGHLTDHLDVFYGGFPIMEP
jgi:alkyl sulfatase BDS1-like metallo-beta-lactamase superfamily hydrolase